LLILGIDPGSLYTGYGLVRRRGSKIQALASGRIHLSRKSAFPERLAKLSLRLDELLTEHRPDAVALESLFHGVNSRSLIVLAQTRGAILAKIAVRQIPVVEYSPAEIKQTVTGNGRADKKQMIRMVQILLSLHGDDLASDEADALAVAITCAQRQRFESLTGSR
jgi:crossover junction endodeoxyribonuclease RuvC